MRMVIVEGERNYEIKNLVSETWDHEMDIYIDKFKMYQLII